MACVVNEECCYKTRCGWCSRRGTPWVTYLGWTICGNGSIVAPKALINDGGWLMS